MWSAAESLTREEQSLFSIALRRMMQIPRVLRWKWDGFAQVLVPMGGTSTFPAHKLRIADDLH
jgi:hypothetical protein